MTTFDDVESNRVLSEKELKPSEEILNKPEEATKEKQTKPARWTSIRALLEKRGDVEFRGCTPVPYDERKETKYLNIFTIWFSISCNPLP